MSTFSPVLVLDVNESLSSLGVSATWSLLRAIEECEDTDVTVQHDFADGSGQTATVGTLRVGPLFNYAVFDFGVVEGREVDEYGVKREHGPTWAVGEDQEVGMPPHLPSRPVVIVY